jgi:polysaccharide biosynthesis protein PslG
MQVVATIRTRAGWFTAVLLALAAIAATMGLFSATAEAKKAPRTFYGVVPNFDLTAADYQLMRQAHVGIARIGLFWHAIERDEDQLDWSVPDAQIGAFAASGIQTLPDLFGTPRWVAGNDTTPPVNSPKQQAEWSEFVAEAVRRYGPGGTYWSTDFRTQFPGATPLPIGTWQVWNEVNGPKHFFPKPNVGKYATLLQITHNAIAAQDPNADVLTAGLVSKPTGTGGMPAWKYLKKLLKNKAGKRSFDHVGLHPYAPNDKVIAKDVKKLRKALKKGHKKQAQTWITEVGWSSDPNGGSPKLSTTPKGQAKRLKKTYTRLKKKRKAWKIGGIYWYTLRDGTAGVCDWCPTAGLVTQSRAPKPAYGQYKRVAGG